MDIQQPPGLVMGIDSGPFQDITSIEGGIFGYVSTIGLGTKSQTTYLTGTCNFTLVPINWLPARTFPDEQFTQVAINILVGEAFRDSPSNPFAPALSKSPGATQREGSDNLNSRTTTHENSGQSFVVDDVATGGELCFVQGGNGVWGTTSGTTYTFPPVGPQTAFAHTEYWIIFASNLGTNIETWIYQILYNDTNDPAINTARFWDVVSADDKVTWT